MLDDTHWLVTLPIAHRGWYDADRPENSLAAFDAAAEAGFACELDVQRTDAGELVVVHDYELSRLTGEPVRTATLSPEVRRRLRLAGTDQGLPTLPEVLACVGRRVPLLIELKRPGVSPRTDLARAVVEEIKRYGGPCALASFDPILVWALRRSGPGVPVGQISGRLRSADPLSRAVGRSLVTNHLTRPEFLVHELDDLPSPAVSRWRRRGVRVIAWTVTSQDEEARARQLADNVIFSGYHPAAPMR